MTDDRTSPDYEPPCVGLDPDTDPCPICGAWLSDPCPKESLYQPPPSEIIDG